VNTPIVNGKPVRVVLAPMEGVVDAVIRDIFTKIGGVDLCVTEFIRVTDRCVSDTDFRRYAPELFRAPISQTEAGIPMLVQFLGGKPEPIAQSAVRAHQLGAAGIDLNFGCPAKTVNRHDGGAALLKDPKRVFDVTSAVRNAVPHSATVSAKIRLGFSDKSQFLEIAKAAEEAGASWLAVHARTRDEGYRPPAHWEYIAQIRESLKIPVIANGEIWSIDDFRRCREITQCDTYMVGRGLMANPYLALQIQKELSQQNSESDYSWNAIAPWVQKFYHMSRDYRSSHYGVCRLKQWSRSLAKTYPAAEELFQVIKSKEDFAEIDSLLSQQSI
jgi:tRNA-dihydrouridine synthase C